MFWQNAPQEEEVRRPTASSSAVDNLKTVCIDGHEHESECPVCLEKFAVGDMATKLPCGHLFHGECVGKWLREHDNRCPVCRHELQAATSLQEEGQYNRHHHQYHHHHHHHHQHDRAH